jgi:hypothetical protein
MQHELTEPGPLLTPSGSLAQVGWSRQPLLDCNLESAAFYSGLRRPFQRFRVKRWDYYALFTPTHFFSATIADLGYAANIFVYAMDFDTRELHEEGLIVSPGKVQLPRNSQSGKTVYEGKRASLSFVAEPGCRQVKVNWPSFNQGLGISADLRFDCPPDHESMTIVIPIRGKSGKEQRFYYNRKINCLPAAGLVQYGPQRLEVSPTQSLGSLDWGRGVWEYRSFWNWASASGFLPDGRTVGLNLGQGFGDLSAAGENALVLDGRIHKLGVVRFDYDSSDYAKPWRFTDAQRRVDLCFTPFKERIARSNLLLIFSEVHQMFGHYSGTVIADDGEVIAIAGLKGFAEEHHARW